MPSRKAFEPTSQRFRTTEIFYLPEDCKSGENGVIVRSLRILWDLWHFLHRVFIYIDTGKSRFSGYLIWQPSGRAFEPTSQRFRTTEIFYLPEDCKSGENGVNVRSLRILWNLWHFLQRVFIYIDTKSQKSAFWGVDLPGRHLNLPVNVSVWQKFSICLRIANPVKTVSTLGVSGSCGTFDISCIAFLYI